jgi:uncharacterized GH25 family protein
MKKMLLLLIALLLVAGTGFAAQKAMEAKADDYAVKLVFGKAPTTYEAVLLTVILKDAAGKPVTDAKVTVEYYMNLKQGQKSLEMPYHKSEAETKAEPSGYTGKADFSMGGRWNVNVKIEKDGKVSTAKFYVTVK